METVLAIVGILAALWAGIVSALLWREHVHVRRLINQLQMKNETGTQILLDHVARKGALAELTQAFNGAFLAQQGEKEALRREARSYRESITSISHDIRTPLTSAKGYVQMMGDPAVPEARRREYAGIVERRLDALTELLDQLFLYARVQAGQLTFARERLNAGNLFAETVSLFYEDFIKKGCEPELVIPKEPCLIDGDREAFVRVTGNLVKNALVHGTGDYCLELRREEACAVIRVSNRTDSIGPADMERIFDRFYTTDLSRTKKNTGLGLSIVKEFTERMGGAVCAGLEGECFWIEARFPLYGHSFVDKETILR